MNDFTRRQFLSKLCLFGGSALGLGLTSKASSGFFDQFSANHTCREIPRANYPIWDTDEYGVARDRISGQLEEACLLGCRKVTLMAVGDIMMHGSNIRCGYDDQTKKYDFSPYFQEVAPLFNKADWVLGNLETRLAGKEARYTGYPLFNAPDELASALKKTGFTMVTTANNHCLDRHRAGIISTNEALSKAGLLHTGTFTSREDHDKVRILKKNGLRLAMLAYTYGTNGLPIPKGEDYLVNLIDFERIKEDLVRAKAKKPDFICCAIHFGYEYARKPNRHQIETVERLFDLGVDIILGSHPHVVQPYEIRPGPQGKKVVIYSMGNFIAGQRRTFTNLGVIFKVVLAKTVFGSRLITDIEAIPTRIMRMVVDNRWTYKVMPIKRVINNKEEYNLPQRVTAELEKQYEMIDKHVRSMQI